MLFKYTKILAIGMGLMASVYAEKKPNIIFILADDMGYGDVSYLNEDSKIQTPILDKMAENGMIFTDAHTSSSVCTPSRYGILTGRYNWRSTLKRGVVSGYGKALIPQDRTTMASMLKSAGYDTALIGKWHLGWNWGILDEVIEAEKAKSLNKSKKPQKINPHANIGVDFAKPVTDGPRERGFDYYFAISGSLDMPPYVYVENDMPTDTSKDMKLKVGGRVGPVAKDLVFDQVLRKFVDKSCTYIKEHSKSEKPFFLYLPIAGPHAPLVPSAKFKGTSGINLYADFVAEIDFELGRIFNTLKEEGIEDNTIIIFTADNGCSPAAGIPALLSKGHNPNYVFRGTKADLFDGGHRVPCIVQWKDKFGKSVANQTICLTDFFRTFAGIVGYKLEDNEGEDSLDLMSIFEDSKNAPEVRKSTIHHSFEGEFSIRMGDWKLLVTPTSGGWSFPCEAKDKDIIATLPELQLYNMKSDIGETKNLIKENPEKAKEMLAQLRKEIEDGRSTEGKKQSNDASDEWTQLDKVNKEYF